MSTDELDTRLASGEITEEEYRRALIDSLDLEDDCAPSSVPMKYEDLPKNLKKEITLGGWGMFVFGIFAGFMLAGFLAPDAWPYIQKIGSKMETADSELASLKDSSEAIKRSIDKFDDGSTDWREIVSDLESEASDLKRDVESIDEALLDVGVSLMDAESAFAPSDGE